MIIQDTHWVSVPLKPLPHPGVLHWLKPSAPGTLFTTSISLTQLLAGVDLVKSWTSN
jgi:hypothetical protein